eukprot:6208531-Pleurochrysis_carterae.AAC.8
MPMRAGVGSSHWRETSRYSNTLNRAAVTANIATLRASYIVALKPECAMPIVIEAKTFLANGNAHTRSSCTR